MPSRYYVDTSAYLALILGEEGALAIQRELAGGAVVSSVLLVLEATRNLIRLSRAGALSPADLQQGLDRVREDRQDFGLRNLSIDLCSGTEMPVVSTPRSLDLAHLRTALWFHRREPLRRFLTLDTRQLLAAREFGLPV